MKSNEINAVLAGRDNSLNRTILEILQEQDHIQIEHWPAYSLEEKLNEQPGGSIDLLLADLRSFSGNVLNTVRNISKHEAVKAVLAIHVYPSLKPVKKLFEAGVTGYLPQNTNERQILNAVESVLRGKKFIGLNEKTGIGENT